MTVQSLYLIKVVSMTKLETKLGLPRSEFTKDLSDDSMTGSTSNVLDDLPGTSTLLVNGEYDTYIHDKKFVILNVKNKFLRAKM
ncbi:hypothetical protein Anas_14337 [Armadillidium nasatum]|uniref:Uncharacterized protein n=1 Tax=Armadillidium nasatum TaxID=96803 RepID=A0A5N5T1R7_9CRUS|nr:hypothetical protein Anas_14337 [Armadillidium nasatum]